MKDNIVKLSKLSRCPECRGKYNAAYATKYAGIWALGYETLHRGENEGLYRTVNEMVLSEGRRKETSTILPTINIP
jgi:hypothetical protein